MPSSWFIALIAILGCASALLTFAKLYQLKEWRWDRLREHIRMAGWIGTFGRGIRPVIYLIAIVAVLLVPVFAQLFASAAIGVIVVLNAAQFLLGKQPMPVWTRKAQAIVGLSIALTVASVIAAAFLEHPWHIIAWLALGIVQPIIVGISCVLFIPVDRHLKHAIMAQAATLRERDAGRVAIGIVGSVGKTTTKELISHLLQDLQPIVTPEHVNTEMGVAQWLLRELPKCPPSHPLVVEMGAYRRGEVSLLSSIVQPTTAVITALGGDHLALFGSEHDIVEANGEILLLLPENGTAFCAIDTEGGRALAAKTSHTLKTVGTSAEATHRAQDVKDTPNGLSFRHDGEEFLVPLRGKHHVVNVLLALCVARHHGIALPRIKELLATFKPLSSTFNVRHEREITLVDDTYNASRLSMLAALDWAAEQPQRPRTLLTAGLLELGKEEERILQEIGKHAVGKVDRVIFTSDHGQHPFAEGYGMRVEILSQSTGPVPPGSLLLCVGRMPRSTIEHILPS